MTDSPLEFTGERFTPECVREIWYEHWHRYVFARTVAKGRRVLDAACGEGYGSAHLSSVASSVLGVDLSPDTIEHARHRYGAAANLRFEVGDCTALDALPDAGFDLIVSFETLEHVAAQERMLDGFARLLAPGGLLLISTPDKRNYSEIPGTVNEHHVRELYREEFEALLAARFAHRRLYAQKLLFQSVLWAPDVSDVVAETMRAEGDVRTTFDYPPMYYVALCGREPLPTLPSVSLFGDAAESVYAHYHAEIRNGIYAAEVIGELRRQLDDARTTLEELRRQLDAARR